MTNSPAILQITPETLGFTYNGDAHTLIKIENHHASAVIDLFGAQVLSFVRKNQELLWLSPLAKFDDTTPVRGGIPLCLPWFGKHVTETNWPAHGFARTACWRLTKGETLASGETQLTLELTPAELSAINFPAFHYCLVITVGRTLHLALTAQHLGNKTIPFAMAFHTYFAVADVWQAKISGLENCRIEDRSVTPSVRRVQKEAVQLSKFEDMAFFDVGSQQQLETAGKHILVESFDTKSAVVWNPGGAHVADIGEHFTQFICLERGDVLENARTLQPNESYHAQMKIELLEYASQ